MTAVARPLSFCERDPDRIVSASRTAASEVRHLEVIVLRLPLKPGMLNIKNLGTIILIFSNSLKVGKSRKPYLLYHTFIIDLMPNNYTHWFAYIQKWVILKMGYGQ